MQMILIYSASSRLKIRKCSKDKRAETSETKAKPDPVDQTVRTIVHHYIIMTIITAAYLMP